MNESWIVPCNPKVYDIVKHFTHLNKIVWRNAFTMKPGDSAYLYFSLPLSEIKYKCIVVSDEISQEMLAENSYAIPKRKPNNYFSKRDKYIILKLEKEFPQGTFPLIDLRKHGLGQVQLQARLNRQLREYICSVEDALDSKGKELDGVTDD